MENMIINCKKTLLGITVISIVVVLFSMNAFASSSTRPSNGWYIIQSGNSSSRVLDVNNWNIGNGGNLEIYQKNKTTNQIFYLQYLGNGYYSIQVLHSGRFLHIQSGNMRDNVHQWEGYSHFNAQWAFEYCGNAYYKIRNRAGNGYLDNNNGSTANGNNVGTFDRNNSLAQKWKLISVSKPSMSLSFTELSYPKGTYKKTDSVKVAGNFWLNYPVTKVRVGIYTSTGMLKDFKDFSWNYISGSINVTMELSDLADGKYYSRVSFYNREGTVKESVKRNFTVTTPKPNPISNGWYMIQSGNSSSRVLDINNWNTSNGGNLEIYQKNKTTNQIFYLQYLGNGYYSIQALHSSKFLHVTVGTMLRDNVHQWQGQSSYNSHWAIEEAGRNGYYYIRNRAGNGYLDNNNGSTMNGNNVGTFDKNNSAAQQWRFISVSKPAYSISFTKEAVTSAKYKNTDQIRAKGRFSSNYPIAKAVIAIYNSQGSLKSQKVVDFQYVNGSFDEKISLEGVPTGTYNYKVTFYSIYGTSKTFSGYSFNVVKDSVPSTLAIYDAARPGTIEVGSGFTVTGLITSNYTISNVKCGIYDSTGKEITAKSVNPNSKEYDLNKIDADIHFSYAKPGTNYYRIWASDAKQNNKLLLEAAFTVKENVKLSYGLYQSTSARLTCGFDKYSNTPGGTYGRHEGIDFSLAIGKPIYSLTDGVIIRITTGYRGRYGLSTIAIYNEVHNKTIIYLHSAPLTTLSVGQTVEKGQQLAVQDWRGVSSSGSSHTHVEVRNGRINSAAKSVDDYVLENQDPTSFWNSLGYTVA